ncbi:MAG: hypothetical protein ACD_2C00133G0004 [uncultured bacterium (gcode 4)]|uniref:Uncharacterized protein n=1 Tax=uncultured bacterium (gcode 4) TaxID=1234023 RepID=K2G366_9BACT|nr:MAG: hypothetical protein ACD_2C00133G0004 [uncultured bacterium (gcode 4)]
MTIQETLEKKAEWYIKQKIDEKLGSTDVTINSLTDLKKELNLWNLDTSKLEAIFKEPIKTSKENLRKLQANLLGTDEEKLKELEKFILDKTKITAETADKTKDLQKKVAIWAASLAAVAAVGAWLSSETVREGFHAKMEEVKWAEWWDKLWKLWEFFDWWAGIFNSFKALIAVKVPFLAKWLGWDANEIAAEAAKKTAEKWEAIATEAKSEAEKAKSEAEKLSELNSPESWAKRKDDLTRRLSERWGVDINTANNKAKFESCWERYMNNIWKDIKEGERKIKAGEAFYMLDTATEFPVETFKFMVSLVTSWLIPKEAIVIEAKAAWEMAFRYWIESWKTIIGLWNNWLEDFFWEISLHNMGKAYSELDSNEKLFLWNIINRKLATMTMLLGATAWMVMDSTYLIATWHERVWVLSWTMTFNSAIWKYDKVAEWIEELVRKTGGTMTDAAVKIREDLVFLHTQTKITECYLKSWEDTGKFVTELRWLATANKWIINTEVIDDLLRKMPDTAKGLSSYQKNIAEVVWRQQPLELGLFKNLTWKAERFAKWMFADANLWWDDILKRTNLTRTTLSEAVVNRWKCLEMFSRLKNCFKIAPLPWAVNNSMMSVHINNVDEFNKVLSYGSLNMKNLVAWLFRNLPIIIVGYNAMALGKTAEDKLSSTAYGLSTLIPFAWPILIMRHGTKLENWTMPNTCDMLVGGALLTFDTFQLIKIISTKWLNIASAAEFFGRPVLMMKDLAWGVLQTWYWACRIGVWAYEAWKAWTLAEAAIPFMKNHIAWVVVLWAVAVLGYYLYNWEVPPDKIIEKLKADWFIDKDWNLVAGKIKSSFGSLKNEQKNLISTIIVESCLNWPIHTANALAAWTWAKLTNKQFEIKPDWAQTKILFKSIWTVQDRNNIRDAFSQLWINVEFAYSPESMREFAREFKEKWKTKNEFIASMNELGVDWNPERYYS